MSHWAANYIGLPYAPGARGPETVDCWGLVRLVYQQVFSITLPEYPGVALTVTDPRELHTAVQSELTRAWKEITQPRDGSLVAMGQGRDQIHHAGVFAGIDGGMVIHCWRTQRVIADKIKNLRLRGMQVVKFYEYGLGH